MCLNMGQYASSGSLLISREEHVCAFPNSLIMRGERKKISFQNTEQLIRMDLAYIEQQCEGCATRNNVHEGTTMIDTGQIVVVNTNKRRTCVDGPSRHYREVLADETNYGCDMK